MKYLLLALFFFFTSGSVFAQKKAIPQEIPPYRILTVPDSTYQTPADLKKNRPVIVIYFAPDCDHCEQFAQSIIRKIKTLRDAQLIFITFAGYQSTKNFVKKFGLSKYPNITVGTEGYTYTVQRFYRVTITPFTAVYHKSGRLLKTFSKIPKVEDMTALLKY